MARILFSNPPWWPDKKEGEPYRGGVRAGSRWPFTSETLSSPDHRARGDYTPYPFFLGFAASYAQREFQGTHQILFRDSIALRESYESYARYLEETAPAYIVIESATPSWDRDPNNPKSIPHDRDLIDWLSYKFMFAKIIVTGPIVAAKGERIFQDAAYRPHAAVKGEYEKGVVRAIKGERGLIEFDPLSVEEMNAAPVPWMDDQHWDLYWDCNPKGQQWPQLQAWTSRGCTYRCLFCSWPASMTNDDPTGEGKRRIRYYTPEYLESFLSRMVAAYPYKSIYFDDDLMNFGDKHTLGVCQVMRKIGLPWSAMCRADTIKRDTWKAMHDSGCFGVKIGFESGNQDVVNNIVHKQLDIRKAADTAHFLQSIGMTVHGTFMLGLPGETAEQVQQTKDFIAELDLDSHQCSGTAKIDGTPLATLLEVGRLKRYPGANPEGFDADSDGARKLRHMTEGNRASA